VSLPAGGNAVRAGTRDDPHAQSRAARELPLLLHSMSVFREMFEILFANRTIRTVVEIGVESGQVSSVYAELGASEIYCVDPNPTAHLRAALAQNPATHLVESPSPAVLAELPPADLYVLDGDHNYAVVHAELSWILEHAPDPVIVMHDVLWPCARRDLYYEPSPLPAARRHQPCADGPTVWHDDVTPAGLVGLGAFTVAREAGGDGNGVLTAIEDVLAEPGHDGWSFELVPAVFGMAVMLRGASKGADRIIAALRPYTTSNLLATMENNRIALYTKVLQLQYEAAAHADDAEQLAETINAQNHEINRLTCELDAAEKRRLADLAATRRDNDRLRQHNENLQHQLDQRLLPTAAATLRRVRETVLRSRPRRD
jgi:hypothetical protein